jgi:hypothetical protein
MEKIQNDRSAFTIYVQNAEGEVGKRVEREVQNFFF